MLTAFGGADPRVKADGAPKGNAFGVRAADSEVTHLRPRWLTADRLARIVRRWRDG